jgi:dihydrolipoamide dehydrogenase
LAVDFDVAVIGGGPGGYVCAIRASQLGLKVVVIEKGDLGGTCLNRGCIPTKSLLQSANVANSVKRSCEFGIDSSFASLNLEKILSRSESIVFGLGKGVSGLLAKNNVKVIKGKARFKDKNTVTIDEGYDVTASSIVISTGASARTLPGLDNGLVQRGLVWTSNEAIRPAAIPKKLLIIGSGAIGVELASFYNSAGSDTTMVEIQDRILILEDVEVSRAAAKFFIRQGIRIRTSIKSQNFRDDNGRLAVDLIDSSGKSQTEIFDVAIMAIGIVPNTSDLNLKAVGVETNSDLTIRVYDFQETNQKGIYAIGDVAKAPRLAHKASREGIVAAERIAGVSAITPINLGLIPSCVYSTPQVASIGMTEETCISLGIATRIGKAHLNGNGKANAAGEPHGFVKLIFKSDTGEILGAHMVGHDVSELISTLSVAMAGELTEKELMAAVFPHPTISESIQEATYAAFDMPMNG